MIARIERRIRVDLAGPSRAAPRWSEHLGMFDTAYLIVQAYYVIVAMVLYGAARRMSALGGNPDRFDFLWPLAWMDRVSPEMGGEILANLYVVAGFAGILLWRFLVVRILVAIALLQWAAFPNSFGAIHHGNHEFFWLSVCFLFLPGGSKSALRDNRLGRMRFLYAFSVAPALILLFYTLSGIYKVQDAAMALVHGYFGGFATDAMAQTLARRAIETGSDPMWAEVIINRPILGWPMYLGLYYVELVAIYILFRPSLHRIWGALLIAFHFGTLTFMDIVFPYHVLINGLLFIMSPFHPKTFDLRQTLRAVPFFGWLLARSLGWERGRKVSTPSGTRQAGEA